MAKRDVLAFVKIQGEISSADLADAFGWTASSAADAGAHELAVLLVVLDDEDQLIRHGASAT